eukprot:880897-Rhodomonas_salina.1
MGYTATRGRVYPPNGPAPPLYARYPRSAVPYQRRPRPMQPGAHPSSYGAQVPTRAVYDVLY